MSDTQKLKDAIAEYQKANKEAAKKISEAAENNRASRQAQEAELSRQHLHAL